MTTNDTTTVTGLGAVLGIWAHPDDEAYLMAGTAMLALACGARVACVTATAGEAGETADEDRWPQRELAAIRRAEMRTSLGLLGIDDHEWLQLPDGGLAALDPAQGVELVATVVERFGPDTIVTFGHEGMTGHPDHVAIGDWAAQAARELGGIRVLAATKTRGWYDEYPDVSRLIFPRGSPCTEPADLALEVTLPNEVLDRKIAALRAQASQTSGLIDLMGADAFRTWNRSEYWVDRPLSSG